MAKPTHRRLEELLRSTFPDGVVEWNVDPDEGTYLAEVYPKLTSRLRKIPDVRILFEDPGASRLPGDEWASKGAAAWDHEEDDFPESDKLEKSYHHFFLGLRDESCRYVIEDTEENEDGEAVSVERIGTIGCLVAISELAPVAVIQFDSIEQSEEWGDLLPDVGEHVFSLDGKPIPMETYFLETHGHEGVKQLRRLRDRIARVLDSLEITIIPPEACNEPVAWLKADDEAFVRAGPGEPITILDAFFFLMP